MRMKRLIELRRDRTPEPRNHGIDSSVYRRANESIFRA